MNDYYSTADRILAAREPFTQEQKAELLQSLKDHLMEVHGLLAELVDDDERAKGYWLAGIRVLLDSEHMYMDRSHSIQDTIDEYREENEEN